MWVVAKDVVALVTDCGSGRDVVPSEAEGVVEVVSKDVVALVTDCGSEKDVVPSEADGNSSTREITTPEALAMLSLMDV